MKIRLTAFAAMHRVQLCRHVSNTALTQGRFDSLQHILPDFLWQTFHDLARMLSCFIASLFADIPENHPALRASQAGEGHHRFKDTKFWTTSVMTTAIGATIQYSQNKAQTRRDNTVFHPSAQDKFIAILPQPSSDRKLDDAYKSPWHDGCVFFLLSMLDCVAAAIQRSAGADIRDFQQNVN